MFKCQRFGEKRRERRPGPEDRKCQAKAKKSGNGRRRKYLKLVTAGSFIGDT